MLYPKYSCVRIWIKITKIIAIPFMLSKVILLLLGSIFKISFDSFVSFVSFISIPRFIVLNISPRFPSLTAIPHNPHVPYFSDKHILLTTSLSHEHIFSIPFLSLISAQSTTSSSCFFIYDTLFPFTKPFKHSFAFDTIHD